MREELYCCGGDGGGCGGGDGGGCGGGGDKRCGEGVVTVIELIVVEVEVEVSELGDWVVVKVVVVVEVALTACLRLLVTLKALQNEPFAMLPRYPYPLPYDGW